MSKTIDMALVIWVDQSKTVEVRIMQFSPLCIQPILLVFFFFGGGEGKASSRNADGVTECPARASNKEGWEKELKKQFLADRT